MPPLREYQCNYCGHEFEEVVSSRNPEDYQTAECRCGSKAKVLPALIGGYKGDMGPSSVTPRRAAAMPGKKSK